METVRQEGALRQGKADMIEGGIFRSILWFSIPLLIGNFFQQLYNTVDSYVVGNFEMCIRDRGIYYQ